MTKRDGAFTLKGKTALITGAARGIGAACAETLTAAGARIMLTDVLEDAGREQVAALKADGGEADFVTHDVTDEGQWESAVDATVKRFGGLDVVVNNAGIEILKPVFMTTLEEWRRVQAVNVDGVFLGVKHGILAMMPGGAAGKGGSIINVSSVAGLVGFGAASAYSASKGAVRLLTKCAALECAQGGLGIRVNSVHPGVIQTSMADSLGREIVSMGMAATDAEATELMTQLHPIGRLGEAVDVARVVQFLASDASRFVTGSEYVVDGGYTAR
jgi:NAD(P)-dependent dehydrogenase (short-subunit alcohol dehydrogenase family)